MNKELYQKWIKAKKAEEKAKNERVIIEEELEKTLPLMEGSSKTYSEDGYKITVKKSESYSFSKEWESVRESIPENMRPERIKYEVEKAGFDWLKSSTDPEEKKIYKLVSNHVTLKVGKTGWKIEKE
jgi:uncharacterized lipoprotein